MDGMCEGDLFRAEGFDPSSFEASANVIYALSADLRLRYCNPAWFRFARENGGEPALSRRFPLGSAIVDALDASVREFYLGAWRYVLDTGEVWEHVYECSSDTVFRLYHQRVYPLRETAGLLVVHSLALEMDHDPESRPVLEPVELRYRAPTGLITQCVNCRRVRRLAVSDTWDWVPDWARRSPADTTGGICPLCYGYYWCKPRRF